jgi:hypothetical protein
MKVHVAVVSAILGLCAGVSVSAAEDAAGNQHWKGCVRCHQPPDLAFATDRAWLNQVRETA